MEIRLSRAWQGGEPETDITGVTVELCHDQPPRLAGRADDKDRRLLG